MHSRELRLRVTTDQGHTLFNMEVAAQRLMLSGCSAQFKVIQLRFAKHCCPGQCCSLWQSRPTVGACIKFEVRALTCPQ
jgi:hypothetical protein